MAWFIRRIQGLARPRFLATGPGIGDARTTHASSRSRAAAFPDAADGLAEFDRGAHLARLADAHDELRYSTFVALSKWG